MSWSIYYVKRVQKDARKIKQSNLKPRVQRLLEVISSDPFATPPPYEKLVGDLSGLYSRRINIQHRLVYQVIEEKKAIKILSMWSHYE